MAVRMDQAALRFVFSDPRQPVFQHLSKLAERTKARATQLVSHRTGNLAASIKVENTMTRRGVVFTVGSDLRYAASHHQGSKPHFIRAKNKALVFDWPTVRGKNAGGVSGGNRGVIGTGLVVVPVGGGFGTYFNRSGTLVIGKSGVNHPGTKENKYLLTALEEVISNP